MEPSWSQVWRMVRIPALIALALTLVRLTGELLEGPELLFNRAPGGPGALVGIAWLVPIFGVYFALELLRAGRGPASAGRVLGFVLLGVVAMMAIAATGVALTGDPNIPGAVGVGGVFAQQLAFAVATVVVVWLLWGTWPAFFKTMLGYGVLSRIPVVIVMLVAMIAEWGTHYEAGPPGYPEMSLAVKFVAIAVFPQFTAWICYTLLFGGLTAAITAFFVRPAAAPQAAPSS